jgi:hypothetical protein
VALARGTAQEAASLRGSVTVNRQPQAETKRPGDLGLPKLIEYVREEVRVDADAGVGDDKHDVGFLARDADVDAPACRCELHGVRQQVAGHLPQAGGVATHHTGLRIDVELQRHVLLRELRLHRADGVSNDVSHVDLDVGEADLPGRDARDIEKVLDEIVERLRVPIDGRPGFRHTG